jgi:hypothetical protein
MGHKTLSDPRAELARLKDLLARRTGQPGFSDNVKAIKAAIAKIEAELAEPKS